MLWHYKLCILLNIPLLGPRNHQENLKKWIKTIATADTQNFIEQNHTKYIVWNQIAIGIGRGVGIIAIVFREQFILRPAQTVEYFLS